MRQGYALTINALGGSAAGGCAMCALTIHHEGKVYLRAGDLAKSGENSLPASCPMADVVVVTQEMIDIGKAILEETGETWVWSDCALKEAFLAMYLCSLQP